MRRLLTITGFICFSLSCAAQDAANDSIPDLIKRLHKSAADTNRVSLLLSLSNAYLLKPGSEAADMNAAIANANNAAALSQILNYHVGLGRSDIALSKASREKGDNEHGKIYAQKAVDVLSVTASTFDIGNAWVEKAAYLDTWNHDELLLKIECYKKGVQALKESGNKLAYAKQLNFLAELIGISGNVLLSLQYLHEALYTYHAIKYEDLAGIYDLMGAEYSLLNNFTDALKYGLLAARIAEKRNDRSPQMGTIYNRLGLTYYRTDDNDNALLYFQKSITVAQNYADTDNIVTIAHNLCDALIKQKKYDEAVAFMQDILKKYPHLQPALIILSNSSFVTSYRYLKQYTTAQLYFDKIENLAKPLDKYSYIRNSVYKVGIPLFFDTHDYQRAAKLNTEYAEYNSTDTSSLMMASTYLWKSKIDSARGDFRSAFINNQKYDEKTNAIYNEAKSNQLASVQVQFDTEKKEQDILNLTHQAELQQARFNQERLVRNAIIGSAALLFLVSLLLYNRYRLKQKTNKKLLLQQQEINQKNQSLQELIQELHKLINEKEWLVKEIHHRVKNNLQIVVSLLNTQAAHLKEGEALNAITESQHRMQAISLLHQKLYHHNDSSISMNDYITEMVSYLKESFPAGRIYFDVAIDEIKLDVSQAAPVGLILNEAITNAIKYAFPGNANGVISIELRCNADNIIFFTIADNGIGLPADWKTQKKASMGIKLMETLTEQLEGAIDIEGDKGVSVHIEFDMKQEHPAITSSAQINSSAYYA